MYLFAFISVFNQIHTLWGFNGILPQQWFLKRVEPQILKQIPEDSREGPYILLDKYFMVPSLLWFAKIFKEYFLAYIPFSSMFAEFQVADTMQYAFCLWGIALSLFLFLGKPKILMNSFSYAILWVLYLSHFVGGDRFMTFQWDICLLEGGFLAIFFAPLVHTDLYDISPSVHVVRELLRYFIFRLMFASGVVKLLSGCKTWWSLTALHYHYETQPIPHMLSWYAQQMPDIHKKYSVVGTYVVEIFMPLLFYSPFRLHRTVGSVCNMILMIIIMLTGNYNFFNMLTIVLLLVVLDDRTIYKYVPNWAIKALGAKIPFEYVLESAKEMADYSIASLFMKYFRYFLATVTLGAFFYWMNLLFPYDLVQKGKINFTKDQLKAVLTNPNYLLYFYLYLAIFTSILLLSEALKWLNRNRESLFNAFSGALSFTFMLIFGYILFLASTHVFLKGVEVEPKLVPYLNHETANKAFQYTQGFHITSSYGLFRSMTGVGGRPELVLLGSQDFENWQEYEFHFKPNNVTKAPQVVMPHQPRFDWQLWFSALTQFDREYYLVHFLYKLLNNDTAAKELIAYDPFNGEPPKYLKIDLYNYWFTDYKKEKVTFGLKTVINTLPFVVNNLTPHLQKFYKSPNVTEKLMPDNWWRREYKSKYADPVTKETLEDFIIGNKLAFYNTSPNASKHPLSMIPVSIIAFGLSLFVLILNISKKKLQVITVHKSTGEEYLKYMDALKKYVDENVVDDEGDQLNQSHQASHESHSQKSYQSQDQPQNKQKQGKESKQDKERKKKNQ